MTFGGLGLELGILALEGRVLLLLYSESASTKTVNGVGA